MLFELNYKKNLSKKEKDMFNKIFDSGILDEKETKLLMKQVSTKVAEEPTYTKDDMNLTMYFKGMVEKYNSAIVINPIVERKTIAKLRTKYSDNLIKGVISRVYNDQFWSGVITDAKMLAFKFDKLMGQFKLSEKMFTTPDAINFEIDFDGDEYEY